MLSGCAPRALCDSRPVADDPRASTRASTRSEGSEPERLGAIQPGSRVAGRYVVREELGSGGMGVVYLAHDERSGTDVALKVLRPPYDAEASRRLRREAAAASALDPARVAGVLEQGEMDDGAPFLAMAYVDGQTVHGLLQRGRLELAFALQIVREVAVTLGQAHRLGLVHRDVKPSNIMVRKDGGIVHLDFGIVKRLEPSEYAGRASTQITRMGAVLGTPAYLAPEQALGREVGPESDQFALAVTAYELLTGARPWMGANVTHLLEEILMAQAPPASAVNPSLPRAVDGVLWRGLSKARGARFESVDAFAEALVAAASGEEVALGSMATVEGPPVAPAQRGSPGPGRRMRAVGALIALVALGTGGWWLARGHVPRLASGPAVAPRASAAHVSESPFRPAFTGACDPSTDPNVARLYAAAMQSVRDAALEEAGTSLRRLSDMSSGLAKAHLAWVLMATYIDDDSRWHYRAAALHRAALDDREREVLNALAPLFDATPDVAATKARLRAAAERSPNDGDIAFQFAQAQWRAGELAAEEKTLTELLRRDPRFALAREKLGQCREFTGDKEGAIEAYRSCVDVAPAALACLVELTEVQARVGLGADAVATSRSAIAIAPSQPAAYDELAATLLGTGAATESVRAAAGQGIVRLTPAGQAESRATWRARLAAVTGDFDEALRATEEWTRAVADRTDAFSHYMPVDFRARLLLEVGRSDEGEEGARGLLAQRARVGRA